MSTERLKISTDELQRQQLVADENPDASEIEMTNGNVDSSYEFPKHEQHQMHVELVKKENDPVAKEYRTVKTVWKGPAAQFERMSKTADKGGTDAFADYDSVTILHDVRAQSVANLKASSKPTSGEEKGITGKPLRTKPDYQARYKELTGDTPDEKLTVDQLKEGIAYYESEEGQKELADRATNK